MLYYLYTGSVLAEKMSECCEDVFHLAERYSITGLKQVALSFMAAQVDESNVVKMALIASKVPSQVLLQVFPSADLAAPACTSHRHLPFRPARATLPTTPTPCLQATSGRS